ncbi:SRPBCC family protein [Nocardioides guangzhouensis]|uniref:SRPBCC family protein n=1 Tax=Nocardioides guangzhouensis TaxID=2497878 RepID=A0A4Q4Z7S4_9ACTN|nr:SRPBCC family protein [Nocardioides guangzhouensis]RYP83907.1 SRPBCC family protein [Nocardioides guangzhouensis]
MNTFRQDLEPDLALVDGQAVVRFEQTWDTDAADLWEAVTDPGRLARWFAPVEGDPVVGGEVVVHFDDGDVPGLRVLACDAGRSFTVAWPMAQGGSEVDVEVRADGPARSTLVLTHRLLPRDKAAGYAAGWTAHVGHLHAHLAGGKPGDWAAAFGAARERMVARVAALGD